jgi:hypothetical protein
MAADHWWGLNGPGIFMHRNRVVGTGSQSNIGVNRDKAGQWGIASDLIFIGNTSYYFYGDPPTSSGFPGSLNQTHDIDGPRNSCDAGGQCTWNSDCVGAGGQELCDHYCVNDPTISCNVTNDCISVGGACSRYNGEVSDMHVEKNLWRNTTTCDGDHECGWQLASAVPTTSGRTQDWYLPAGSGTHCGTVSGPNDCAFDNGGSNEGATSPPAGWATDSVPHSFYRSSEPFWWCQEACAWDDVHNGIGAWGDDFGGTLCKLPAQIMAEAGTCTPPGATATGISMP